MGRHFCDESAPHVVPKLGMFSDDRPSIAALLGEGCCDASRSSHGSAGAVFYGVISGSMMSTGRSRDSFKLDANIVWWLADRLRLFRRVQSHFDIFETLRNWPLVKVMTMAYDIIDAVVIVSIEKICMKG